MQPEQPELQPGSQKPYLERATVFVLAQVVLMTIMLHASYKSGFYDIDDKTHITPSLVNGWEQRIIPSTIPVTVLSFKADYEIARRIIKTDEPPPAFTKAEFKPIPNAYAPYFRVMNGLYQIGAGVFLWLFLRRIAVGSAIAFLVALLWTAHPMNCENVCWVIERKGVLCAFFGFASLLAWTMKSAWRYVLTTVLYALALGSKPAALGLLPLYALLEILVPREQPFAIKEAASWRRLLGTFAGPLVISLLVLFPIIGVFNEEIVAPPGGSLWTAILTDVEIFFRYIHHTLVPFRLTFSNSVVPIVSVGDLRLWLYGIPMLAFLIGLVWASEPAKRPLAVLGILWFFAALGPNSNLISIVYWMQDRYAVLSIPGMLLAVMLAAQGLVQRFALNIQWLRIAGAAYVLLFVGLLAYRAGFYVNTEVLELDAALHQPKSAFARLNAARIFNAQMQKYGPGGQSPDPQRFQMAAKATLYHLDGALESPDLYLFRDKLDTRLAAVEILGQLGLHAEVKKLLNGWLPPPDMEMLKVQTWQEAKEAGISRGEVTKRYFPSALARGWALMAESSFQLSFDPRLKPEERRALLELATKEADKSLEVKSIDHSAKMVKARALAEISAMERAAKRTEEADKAFAGALQILNEIPKDSRWYWDAQQLIQRLQSPPAPKPEVPKPPPPAPQ